MNILITGAQGFLGRATRHMARSQGLTVHPTARTDAEGCTALDITDTARLLATLDRMSPDAVVNCAAMVTFESETLTDQYPVNCLAPSVLAAWCAENKRHLVHVSSAAVAGVKCPEVSAATPHAPDTDYGTAKCLAEEMISASGSKYTCIRFGGIFGHPGPMHLGLNRAISRIRQGVAPEIVGHGRGRRNYIHVDDAARTITHCIIEDVTGIHAAGGCDVLTIAEIMTDLCEVFEGGMTPTFSDGAEASDQIVTTSAALPTGASFRAGLERCR